MDYKDSKITIILTLDRFENGHAVFVGEREEVTLPKKIVPKNAKEGTIVHLSISTDELATLEKKKNAKELLNALLNDHQ